EVEDWNTFGRTERGYSFLDAGRRRVPLQLKPERKNHHLECSPILHYLVAQEANLLKEEAESVVDSRRVGFREELFDGADLTLGSAKGEAHRGGVFEEGHQHRRRLGQVDLKLGQIVETDRQ